MKDYPPPVLEVLRCFDEYRPIPDDLSRLLAVCEKEGLIGYTPEADGLLLDISDVGRGVLLLQGGKKQRVGRRRKDETSADVLLAAAIEQLLNDSEGDRDNPPTGVRICETCNGRLSKMTVSRFIGKHWGGQPKFASAWRRGTIHLTLAKIHGLPPTQMEEYDDNYLSSDGNHQRGHAPGSRSSDE